MNMQDTINVNRPILQNVDTLVVRSADKSNLSDTIVYELTALKDTVKLISQSIDLADSQNISKSDIQERKLPVQSITIPQITVDADSVALSDSVHTLAQTFQEVLPAGEEGILILGTPRTDNGISAILLFCFFLSAYILARSKRFLLQQFKDFFSHRERISIFVSSTVTDIRYLLLLVLQTCILSGFCLFNCFDSETPENTGVFPPLALTALYACCCLIYLFFKWVLYSFLGWVFFDKIKINLWLESYSTLLYFFGFALFPCVLLFVYLDLSIGFVFVMGLILMATTKILMFYKSLKLFSNNIYGLFLLILYFCAIEIMPFFLIYEGALQLNKVLLINF